MPKPIENCSSDLVDLLKDRYEIADSVDEHGQFADDPSEIKVFSFNYINKKGEDKGSVVMSLLDDSESANSLKIYFGQDVADADSETRTEWYEFLQDIRQFAKMHLLGFDARNINKSQITRRDVEKDLVLTKEDIEPMFESSFGPIDGSVKTSKQPLGSMTIVIKHSARVDPSVKNARSRRIEKIYLANEKGERFLLPFKSLLAARAMARHIETGGTPYDAIGRDICQLVEEMSSLNNFYRKHKNNQYTNKHAADAIAATRERYLEIKKMLGSLSSKGGYAKNSVSLNGSVGELEDDDEMFEDIFSGADMDEESQLALPHVMKAYRSHAKSDEETEFDRWVNAAAGKGEGQEMLADEEEPEIKYCDWCGNKTNGDELCDTCELINTKNPAKVINLDDNGKILEDSAFDREERRLVLALQKKYKEKYKSLYDLKADCPACHSDIITSDGIGNYKCRDCHYKWNEDDTEHGYDDSKDGPDDFYESNSQKEQGKLAAQRDITYLRHKKKESENSRPYEYGAMHGTVPSGDAISAMGGQMTYESEMSILKKIIEDNSKDDKQAEKEEKLKKKEEKKEQPFKAEDFEHSKVRDDEPIADPDQRRTQFISMSGSNESLENNDNILNESDPIPWSSCEEYGHRFDIDGEEYSTCVDCGIDKYDYESNDPSVLADLHQVHFDDEPITESEDKNDPKSLLESYGWTFVGEDAGFQCFRNFHYLPKWEGRIKARELKISYGPVALTEILINGEGTWYATDMSNSNPKPTNYFDQGKIDNGSLEKFLKIIKINFPIKNKSVKESKIAMKVVCPDCGAKKGDPCRTKRIINSADKRMTTVHSGRIALAKHVNESNKGIMGNLLDEYQNSINEADVPTSSGWAGPLTFTQPILGSKFRTNDEINKHKNITGKISPLTLLNSPEKEVDDDDKEIQRLSDLARSRQLLSTNAAGFGNASYNEKPTNISV